MCVYKIRYSILFKAIALAMVCLPVLNVVTIGQAGLFFANDISFASESLISQTGKSTLAPPLATKPIDETIRMLEYNKWIVDYIGRIIYPFLKLTKESRLKNPVDLIKADLRRISKECPKFEINRIEAVRDGEKIIGFSLPVKLDGLRTHRLIYNLQGKGEAIELWDGAKVWVAIDATITPAAPLPIVSTKTKPVEKSPEFAASTTSPVTEPAIEKKHGALSRALNRLFTQSDLFTPLAREILGSDPRNLGDVEALSKAVSELSPENTQEADVIATLLREDKDGRFFASEVIIKKAIDRIRKELTTLPPWHEQADKIIWDMILSTQAEVILSYGYFKHYNHPQADAFFKDTMVLIKDTVVKLCPGFDIRFFDSIQDDPIKISERMCALRNTIETSDKKLLKIITEYTWNDNKPVIGFHDYAWNIDDNGSALFMSGSEKADRFHKLKYTHADVVEKAGTKNIYVRSGLILDKNDEPCFVIFKEPVKIDISIYPDAFPSPFTYNIIERPKFDGTILSEKTCELLSNKILQARFFNEYGISAPITIEVSADGKKIEIAKRISKELRSGGELIVKPSYGRASIGVRFFRNSVLGRRQALDYAYSLRDLGAVIQKCIKPAQVPHYYIKTRKKLFERKYDWHIRALIYRKFGVIKTKILIRIGRPGEGVDWNTLEEFEILLGKPDLSKGLREKIAELSEKTYSDIEKITGEDPVLISPDYILDEQGNLFVLELNQGFFSLPGSAYSRFPEVREVVDDIFEVLWDRVSSKKPVSLQPAAPNAGPTMPLTPPWKNGYRGMKPDPHREDIGGAPTEDKLARPTAESFRLGNGWRWLHWLMELEDDNLKIQITKKGYEPRAIFVGNEHQGVLQITAPSYASLKDVVRVVAFNQIIPYFVREKFAERFAELLKNPPPVIVLGELATEDFEWSLIDNPGADSEKILEAFAEKTGQGIIRPKTYPKTDVPKAVTAKSSLDKRKINDMTDSPPNSPGESAEGKALDMKLEQGKLGTDSISNPKAPQKDVLRLAVKRTFENTFVTSAKAYESTADIYSKAALMRDTWHDLRTELGALTGAAMYIEEYSKDVTVQKLREQLVVMIEKLKDSYMSVIKANEAGKRIELEKGINSFTEVAKALLTLITSEQMALIQNEVSRIKKEEMFMPTEEIAGDAKVIDVARQAAGLILTELVIKDSEKKSFVPVSQLIDLSMSVAGSSRMARNTKVNISPEVTDIFCYESKLFRVFLNLLRNPATATHGIGLISINILRQGNDLVAQLSDNGDGMPQKKVKDFNMGLPVKSSEGKDRGRGLNIVRRMIEDHDGIISVESELGKGTTFTIQLPAIVVSAAPAENPSRLPKVRQQAVGQAAETDPIKGQSPAGTVPAADAVFSPTADSERIHADNFRDTIEYMQWLEAKRAEKAKEIPKTLYVALGTSWIKGYKYEKGNPSFQYDALNPLLSHLRNSYPGERVEFVIEDDENLAAELKVKMAEKGPGRVMALAGEETIAKDFKDLDNGENAIFGVDNSELTEDSYMRIIEMLEIEARFVLYPDIQPKSLNIPLVKRNGFWVFRPHAEPMEDKGKLLKTIYEAERFA